MVPLIRYKAVIMREFFAVDTEVTFIDTWLLQSETIVFTLYKKLIELDAPSKSLVVSGLG